MKIREPFKNYSQITRFLFRLMHPSMSFLMDSSPHGARIRPGQKVLEIGCGTGYFTTSAAKLVGEKGLIYAIDIYPPSIERVTRKVRDTHLTNVRVSNMDATDTKLPGSSFDLILLFGVIPAPVLPMDRLLPEMYRLLKPEGTIAVWTLFPWWAPASVTKSRLFAHAEKENGVYNFQKVPSTCTVAKHDTMRSG